jgi:hypothetical protein
MLIASIAALAAAFFCLRFVRSWRDRRHIRQRLRSI